LCLIQHGVPLEGHGESVIAVKLERQQALSRAEEALAEDHASQGRVRRV
jgi:hypothetical protein